MFLVRNKSCSGSLFIIYKQSIFNLTTDLRRACTPAYGASPLGTDRCFSALSPVWCHQEFYRVG